MRLNKLLGTVTLISVLFLGCKTQKGKLEFVFPESGQNVVKGEKVRLKLNFPDTTLDSVVYSVDGAVLEKKTDTTSVTFDTKAYGFGNRNITAKVYIGGKEDIVYSSIQLVSTTPKSYTFEVVNTYDHDSMAFTQGLQYENGNLYESTGLNERSSLRRVNLKTGEVLQKIDLDTKYFGEGLTVVGDKIILLTWTSGIGFVYDKSSFKLEKTFDYSSTKEGWGITYDGERLIKTDGSANLYFLDVNTFRAMGSVQVYDDRGPVDNLNELEYIDGKVYANLYYPDRDEVVIINPNTGAVEGRINFVGLYDGKRQSGGGNEMNGIAYVKETGNLLVTGKDWTKLFEVKIQER